MNIVERFESRRNWRYLAQAEIDSQGGLKLIYIDPPFDVGTDFSMDIEIGGDTFTKKPNILEEIAYRDTWGKGADSFIAMIHERLILMRDLLAECGTIYVHMGPTVNHLVRGVMDEVFGQSKLINEIIWKRRCSFMGTYNKFGSIRVPKEILPDGQPLLPGMKKDQPNLIEWEEQWTGDFVFENEWQSFRTKQDRSLELTSVYHEVSSGRRKIAVAICPEWGAM